MPMVIPTQHAGNWMAGRVVSAGRTVEASRHGDNDGDKFHPKRRRISPMENAKLVLI